MTTRTCYRCDEPLETPVEDHAHYVIGQDIVSTESIEVAEAIVHTEETEAIRDQLHEEYYPNRSPEEIDRAMALGDVEGHLGMPPADTSADGEAVESQGDQSARLSEAKQLSPPVAALDRVEVTDVADAPGGTIRVDRRVEQREVQKTGLVCRDTCVKDSDEVIW